MRATELIAALCGILSLTASAQQARVVDSPPKTRGALYVTNRDPLEASPFVKLPIGAIKANGWIGHMLLLERDGMSGRLAEISQWCKWEGNAWVTPEGQGHSGWEELPYWLKGYGDLGYVLRDERIIKESRKWIEAMLASQREDGWFGPRRSLTSLDGKPDLWPNMLVLNILQSYYEVSGDPRVITFMTKYFRWQLNCPDKDFMAGYWPKMRAGDNIESIYWLYNRTGEKWLLDVSGKCHKYMANWTDGLPNWHGVNLTQGFREPGIYWMQTHEAKHLKATYRNYDTVMGMYGQFPGGGFGADENCRPGYDDPRQGFETCSIVEFMHSAQMLTKITGDPLWADRCEEMAFNTFPASMTPDLKALHYLTCANQVQLDRGNKAPGVQNGGTMFSYSPGAVYRCCQHNVAHGWPYYVEEMWLATSDKGLCASLYGASEVSAKVGDGSAVKIVEETEYPFSEQVKFTIAAEKTVEFPLYLRVPRWCRDAKVAVNGKAVSADAKPLSYIVVDRQWASGDVVSLTLPMKISMHIWAKNKDSVSVDYGPLTFSLQIGERWSRFGDNEKWPDWEVFPMTAWNYGVVADPKGGASQFEVVKKEGKLADQPFTPESAPIQIKAKARKITQWKQDRNGLIERLQMSPAKSTEPIETITLIPMGAARLRITSFPTVSDAADAVEWKDAPKAPLASHCFENDTTLALNDGRLPKSSSDESIPRFTWWDHKGTAEWVQYDLDKPKSVKGVEVYWYDDEKTGGQCRRPQSWQILVKVGSEWKAVANAGDYGVELDQFNKVSFQPVQTTSIRLTAQLRPEYSAGILEWRVNE